MKYGCINNRIEAVFQKSGRSVRRAKVKKKK